MLFRSHQCWFPKDVEFPRDYEDASARSEKLGRAVVADGVSSAIFSRSWARLLARSFVAAPPDLASEEAIQAWLGPLQQEWRQGINFPGLAWHQKPKATSIGAQSTLLAVAVEPFAAENGPSDEYRLRASGVGDCVLFLVREGRKLFSFPLTDSAAFAEPPQVFSSIAKGVAYKHRFQHLDDRCRVGDLIVLCSDAVGLWAMQEYEAGRDVDWMRYWEDDTAWQADIQALRAKRPGDDGHRMRVDDCTLLLLQVIVEETVDDEPDAQPDRSDEPFVLLGGDEAPDPAGADETSGVRPADGMPPAEAAPAAVATPVIDAVAPTMPPASPDTVLTEGTAPAVGGTTDGPEETNASPQGTGPGGPDSPAPCSAPPIDPPASRGLLARLRQRLPRRRVPPRHENE